MLLKAPASTLLVFFLLLVQSNVASAQSFLQINSSVTSDIFNVEAGAENSLFLAGSYKGDATFGGFAKSSQDKQNYIAHVTADAKFDWVTDVAERVEDLAVTATGVHVLVIIKSKHVAAKTASSEMKLLRYSLTGRKISEQSICTLSGSTYDVYLKGVFDNQGNPMACALWVKYGATTLNGEKLSKSEYGGVDYVKFDDKGKQLWKIHTEGGQDAFTDMHLETTHFDKDNNFYVIGGFWGSSPI